MSYDVYCYQPQSDTPDAKEAQALIQSEEGAVRRDDDDARGIKRKIANALLKYNPRLEPFKIDHNEVAKLMKITHEQAKAQWNHIELNPPQGDLRIQLQIHWDHLSLTIPYWYTGAKADEVFEQLSAYLRVIRDAAGFFAYDPQTNRAFDPQKEEFGEHREYDRIAENLPQIIARGAVRRTNLEVANIIEAFVEGTRGRWDWDDFCSLKIENPELDAIRLKCCQLSDTHPPVVKGHYWNGEGIDILREMVRNLRGLPN